MAQTPSTDAGREENRRSSHFLTPQLLAENTVLRIQKEVAEEDKMKKISYKAMIRTGRIMENWQQTMQDPTKKLQDFLSAQVLLQLLENEKRLGRPYSELLTEATIRKAAPATIMDMIARYLRPMTAHTC